TNAAGSSHDPSALPSTPTRRSSDLRTPANFCVANYGGAWPNRRPPPNEPAVTPEPVPAIPVMPLCSGGVHHVTVRNRHRVSTARSEEHTSELQSRENIVCRLLLEQK